MIRQIPYLFIVLFGSLLQADERITKQDCKNTLSYLASDELKGRGTGQEGNRVAARFIAKQFKQYGLEPIHPPVYIPSGLDYSAEKL